MVEIPQIYFETSVFLDLIEGRSDDSSYLIRYCHKKKWGCVISAFTVMEAIDIEQEFKFFNSKIGLKMSLKDILHNRRERDLSETDLTSVRNMIQRRSESYKFKKIIPMDKVDDWELALQICGETNITCNDAIHLATAYNSASHILVTNDKPFIKEATKWLERDKDKKMRVCEPKDVEKNLMEMRLIK